MQARYLSGLLLILISGPTAFAGNPFGWLQGKPPAPVASPTQAPRGPHSSAKVAAPNPGARHSCTDDLLRMLVRYGDKAGRSFEVSDALPVRSGQIEAHLRPTFKAAIMKQGSIEFKVNSVEDFAQLHDRVRKNGFWVLYNPSAPEAELKSGHASILIDDTLFNRMGDGLGQTSMESMPLPNVMAAWANGAEPHPFVAAQFFEVSPESVEVLKNFFHNRVWNFHSSEGGAWKTVYNATPFSGAAAKADGTAHVENCQTFSWSFMDDFFIQLDPRLAKVKQEVGTLKLYQVPNRQLHNNTQVPSYRGTVMFGHNPREMENAMLDGSFNVFGAPGSQTFFDGPAVRQ